mgnify:CR=1 FL=1
MEHLKSETIITQFNSPMVPYNSSGPFKMEVPQSSANVLKPITYEFRVAEYLDEVGNIKKVGLQYKIYEYSHYGAGAGTQLRDWTDVERVQIPFAG